MSVIYFIWGWERSNPKYYGKIIHSRITNTSESILLKSLSMKCDNCLHTTDLKIFESHKVWKLYKLIPLGNSDYKYDLYCGECNAFQMALRNEDIDKLVKDEIIDKEMPNKET